MFSLKSQGRAEAQGHLNLPFFLPLFLCLSRLFSLPQFFPFLLLLSLFDFLSFFTHSFSHFPFFSSLLSPHSFTIYPSLPLHAPPAISPHAAPQPCLPQVQPPGREKRQKGILSPGSTCWCAFFHKFSDRWWRVCCCFPRGRGHRSQGGNGWPGSEAINFVKGTHP